MPCFLTLAFLFALYGLSVTLLEALPGMRRSRASISAVLLPVFLIVLAIAALASWSLGSWDEMLMLMTLVAPAAAVYVCVKEIRESDASPLTLALLALFLLALGFITVISRDGSKSTKVLFGFYKISKAMTTGSLLPMKHVAENILLFMPFGFLLAACVPGKRGQLLRAGLYALVLSSTIESIQYLFVIGECDLEDVFANVLGAWAGLGVYRLFERAR
jgi:uncharacterized membrane protein